MMTIQWVAICLASLISSAVGQCNIQNAIIRLDESESSNLGGPGNRDVVIEGLYNGSIATSVTWRRNGGIVDRLTVVGNGLFYDGGGETIQGDGPCCTHVYRVALLASGYFPGNYTYTIENNNTPVPVTSSVFTVEEPGPPINVTVKQVSNRRVIATWSPPTDFPEATYRVYVNTIVVNVGGTPVSGTSFLSESLSANIRYYVIRVRATTGTYLGSPAVSSNLTIMDLLLPNVTLLSTTSTSVSLRFSQPKNSLPVDMYRVSLMGSCSGDSGRTEVTTANSITLEQRFSAGMKYSITVTAVNNVTESSSIETIIFTTSEEAPVGRPRDLSARGITSTNITLTWMELDCSDANGVITSYWIRYRRMDAQSHITLYTRSNASTQLVSGLEPYTWYTFSVAGVNSINTGPFSDSINIRTELDLFLSVISLSAESVTLSISGDVNNLSVAHTVTLTSSTCVGVPTRTGSTTSNVVTVGGLQAGIQYTVTVTGTNQLAELTGTGTTTIITNEKSPSSSPGVPAATKITSTNITLSWTDINCLDRNGVVTSYIIKYEEEFAQDRKISIETNASLFVITDLKPFTNYTFIVAGVNSVSTGPFSSSGSSIRTAAARPTIVRNLEYEAKFFSVILSWDIPDPVNGILLYYNIQYTINETNQDTESIDCNTFSIPNLYPNTIISNISVFATNEAGDGPEVTIDEVSTLDKPSMVQNFSAIVVSNTSVRLSWNNRILHDITDYVIHYNQAGVNQGPETSRTFPAAASFCIISGLTTGRMYEFEIFARAVFGKLSVSGTRSRVSSSPVIVILPPAAPSFECKNSKYSIAIMGAVIGILAVLLIVCVQFACAIYYIHRKEKKDSKCKSLKVQMKDCSAYDNVEVKEHHYEIVTRQGKEDPVYVNVSR